MREAAMVSFEVREGQSEQAEAVVREFVANVREHESGTLLYTSYRDKDNPNKFFHFMVFADGEAHLHHRETDYVGEFVGKLYPLCVADPLPVFLGEVDACGTAFEAILKKQ